MSALPDWFDLWVRRARDLPVGDSQRQVDLLLGAVFVMPVVYFWNIGSEARPAPAIGEDEDGRQLALLFTQAGKLEDVLEERHDGIIDGHEGLPVIGVPPVQVGGYLQDLNADGAGIGSILVNPGEYAFQIEVLAWEAFSVSFEQRDPEARGFWIPHMTTEEEDFWEEHGL